MKRYQKTNGAKRLLAASLVVTTQDPIVSPEVELIRKRILTDYERDVFRGEVRLCPGQQHPKVRCTERLGFAKLDLYGNAKPNSVKPVRLVGERAAADNRYWTDLWLVGGLSRVLPLSGRPTVSLSPGKRKKNSAYRQLNEPTLPDAHPVPLIENMLKNQSKHKIFTIVDWSKGFHEIPLHPDPRAKSAMNVAGKRYQWCVIAMGIKNGPAIFQRIMDHFLQG